MNNLTISTPVGCNFEECKAGEVPRNTLFLVEDRVCIATGYTSDYGDPIMSEIFPTYGVSNILNYDTKVKLIKKFNLEIIAT